MNLSRFLAVSGSCRGVVVGLAVWHLTSVAHAVGDVAGEGARCRRQKAEARSRAAVLRSARLESQLFRQPSVRTVPNDDVGTDFSQLRMGLS